MSDDLVKLLRRLDSCAFRPQKSNCYCGQAADRIEELEAALRNIIVHCEVPAPPNAEALKMFARKALEKKNGLAAMEDIRLMQVEIYRLRELLQTISSTCDCWSAAEIRDKIRKELDRVEGKNVAE